MQYVKLYISLLCISNVVFDFWVLPQIMFFNMWVSISGFNYEHHYRSKVILAVVVRGKSMSCGSKGKSSLLSCLQFLSWLYFSFPSFGSFLIFGPSTFLVLSLFFGWSSFSGSSLFLVLSPFFGVYAFFGLSSFLGLALIIGLSSFLSNSGKRGQMGPSKAEHGKIGSKWGQTGYIVIHGLRWSYMVTHGHS